jgi:hypothetical protein
MLRKILLSGRLPIQIFTAPVLIAAANTGAEAYEHPGARV